MATASLLAGCPSDEAPVDDTGATKGIDSVDGSSSSGDDPSTTGVDPSTSTTTDANPTCDDGQTNGDETDLDCGGATCEPCGPGSACVDPSDCDTMICAGGFCQTPNCYDGMQNGDEEGLDCGGTCPNSCVDTGCTNDNQCGDGEFCDEDSGECFVSSCENGIIDSQESDVDCGGPACPDCPDGSNCNADPDCLSGVCTGDVCAEPSCTDGVQNGTEPDIDCGASCPDPCGIGDDCLVNQDCVDGVCDNGTCSTADCTDDVLNGTETDVDCGGTCIVNCQVGEMCDVGEDCVTGVCDDTSGLCAGAICNDEVLNGDETDVDCGGSCGATCVPGEDCNGSGDCVEGVCEFGVCSDADCNDGVENGDETDLDCGGSCGATCEPTEACADDGDCEQGVCTLPGGVCAFPLCNDTVQNQDETDIDCGGAVCGASCETGETCFFDNDCISGVCTLAECLDPTCSDGVQNGSEDGVDCGTGCPLPCPIGTQITANTTLADFQTDPAVAAAPDGSFFVVTWTSSPAPVGGTAQDGDGQGVYARMFDADGVALTNEFRVNTDTTGNQKEPSVAASNTGFVIAWESSVGDGATSGIRMQRYNASGTPQGGDTVVNDLPEGSQGSPDVAMSSTSGAFIVCWEGTVSTFEIFCRRFAANGTPSAGQFQVNVTTTNSQQLPVVGMSSTGAFTVVWQSAGGQSPDGDVLGVFKRSYNASGVALDVSDVLVNTSTALNQREPDIAMAPTGAYTIAWIDDDDDGDAFGVFAQRYNASNATVGSQFGVNTTTAGAQVGAAVAYNAAGDHVMVWQTPNDGAVTGIFGQRYDSSLAAVSTEFRVNRVIAGRQEDPHVAMVGANTIATVYAYGPTDISNSDIGIQLVDAQFQ